MIVKLNKLVRNKEKLILRILVLTEFLIIIIGFIYFSSTNDNMLKDSYSISNNKVKNNALTMMLETDVDSNEYEVATSNEWPQEGYIFNAEMSACERGGTLSWDSENNRVLMATSSADKCYVYFDKYTTVRITNVTTSNITNNSITLTIEATAGESQIATYYFSSNDGVSYEESTSNTYTFSNLETGVEYNFRVYAVDTNGISSNVYTLSESTLSTVYLADYIKNTVYTGDGNNGLYYHDGSGSYTNAAQEAGDNSYRYSGANPNNYVCFASDAASCPNDNLYRIIGVFGDQVKLIKHDYANSNMLGTNGDYHSSSYSGAWGNSSYYKGSHSQSAIPIYYWNRNGSNTWSASQLNTVNLNTNYINYLNNQNSKWAEMIETTSWKVGGNTYQNIYNVTVKNTYRNEIVSPAANTTYSAKIGLMYVSDYGYAASPANWTTILYNYDNDTNRNNNWMFMGLYEWTISRRSGTANRAFDVTNTGNVGYFYVNDGYYGVRPSFYLYPWVGIESGNGSVESPYRLSISELVEFAIAGTTYYLEDGMTWEEWVNSIYNVDGLVVSEGNIFNSTLTSKLSITGSGEFINATDVIDYNNSSTWYWYNV